MLRIFRAVIGILLIPTLCFGAVNQIEEEDGSPTVFPWKIKVPNTSLTNNGDGTVSLDFATPLSGTFLKLDQSTYQTIINGFPEYEATHAAFSKPHQLIDKEYVDSGTWLIPPIIEWYDPTGGLPVDPEVGDRYGADGTAYGWTIDYIYEWDGDSWVESEPEEGWMLWELWDMIFWVFFSGGWMEVGEDSYLKLDQSTPQTITASPIFNWLSASQAIMTDGDKKLVSVDYLNQAVKTTSGPTFAELTLDTAGVNFDTNGDGALTITGMGDGFDEDLTFDFDSVADTVGVSSASGVATIDWGSIGHSTTGTNTASNYTSTVAIGTSPYACTSTTLNTNLNADLLDGKNTGTSGNTIPLLDGTNTWSGVQTITKADAPDPYTSFNVLSGNDSKYSAYGLGMDSVLARWAMCGTAEQFLPGTVQYDVAFTVANGQKLHFGRYNTAIDVTFEGDGDTNFNQDSFFIDKDTREVYGDPFSDQRTYELAGAFLDVFTAPVCLYGWFTPSDAGTEQDLTINNHDATYTDASDWTTSDQLHKGFVWSLDFDGTDDYLTVADSDDFTFSTGDVTDTAFSIIAWVQVVDGGGFQAIIDKFGGEWFFGIDSSEKLVLYLNDDAAFPYRLSDAALSVGWHFVSCTYDGTGGATAANGIILYVDGVPVASTATNDGAYVAMPNTNAEVEIGASDSGASNKWTGDMGMIGVTREELSANDVWKLFIKERGFLNQ